MSLEIVKARESTIYSPLPFSIKMERQKKKELIDAESRKESGFGRVGSSDCQSFAQPVCWLHFSAAHSPQSLPQITCQLLHRFASYQLPSVPQVPHSIRFEVSTFCGRRFIIEPFGGHPHT